MTATQQIFNIIGGLGLFLFGMKVMSEGLQLVAGDRMRAILARMTNNRIKGTITGISITAVIQSSSATTVMVVSLVNAGLITLTQSMGVIFGADIGTTMTAWIVTLFGFKIKIASFALPAIGGGFLIRLVTKGRGAYWGEVILGFGLLFLGLFFLKEAVPDAATSPEIHHWICKYNAHTLSGTLLALLVGTAVTAIVQSSSATTAIVLVMASSGLVDFRTSIVLFLGANIGTTTTALIASVGTNLNARRAAVAHFLFKSIGAAWALLLLTQLEQLVDFVWPGSPYTSNESLLFHLASFHTIFNTFNTIIFLIFVTPFVAFMQRIMPSSKEEDELHHRLKFIDSGLLQTPSLCIASARQEIQRMIHLVDEMFDLAIGLLENQNGKTEAISKKIKEREKVVDALEKQITEFLSQVSRGNVSGDMAREIAGLITATSDIERIGDHCESLLRLLTRKIEGKHVFNQNANKEIIKIADEVKSFLALLDKHIFPKTKKNILKQSGDIEDEINRMRWHMRDGYIRRLKEDTIEVDAGLIFLDMVTSFEKIGDHAYNVSEVISGTR